MDNRRKYFKPAFWMIVASVAFILLYFIQRDNYLLFHAIAEMFSVIIAFSIFIISWNGRKYIQDNYLRIIGISYLCIAFLDLLHTFGYAGMGVFRDYDYYANQLWIAARGVESLSLFTAIAIAGKKIRIPVASVFTVYISLTVMIIYSIFFSDIFPECFIHGRGQTSFKITSEYIIVSVLLVSLIMVFRRKYFFSYDVFNMISLSVIFTIVSELAFTFYVSNYGLSNMLGHYSKIISFYFLYRAIVMKNIQEPYDTIFRELTEQKEILKKSDSLKTGLFSIIAHDLISPFSSVVSFIDTLDEDLTDFTGEELQTYISEIRKSVDSTSLLLYNLLNWSRLEMGGHQIRKAEYLFSELINEAAEPLLPLYNKKNVALEIIPDDSILLYVDKDMFNVVLRNILSNALKFSYTGSKVRVETLREEEKTKIKFQDEGTGMDFNPEQFETAVGTSKHGTLKEKGSGLGMNLIKRYTEENGGDVRIESSPGKGTKVILVFPDG